MLVQPPFTGVMFELAISDELNVPLLTAGVVGQLGAELPEIELVALEPEFTGALLHGDDTPFRVELGGVLVDDGEANGLETCPLTLLTPCSAARMPASTPSRTAFVVSLKAL
jgi:hypothetical protein